MASNNPATMGKSFIVKLHKILSNHEYIDIISWTKDGMSITVKNIPEMMEKVLPAVYKHHNYSSFVRQLNTYGFCKVANQNGENIYYHEYFNKLCKPNYSMIFRKPVQKDRDSSCQPQQAGFKELIVKLVERMSIFEEEMLKRETANQTMILEKLEYLQRMNFQLLQKNHEHEKLIAQLFGRSPAPTATPESMEKQEEMEPIKEEEADFVIHSEISSSGANASLERHWSNFSESQEMAEIFSVSPSMMDSMDLMCEVKNQTFELI